LSVRAPKSVSECWRVSVRKCRISRKTWRAGGDSTTIVSKIGRDSTGVGGISAVVVAGGCVGGRAAAGTGGAIGDVVNCEIVHQFFIVYAESLSA